MLYRTRKEEELRLLHASFSMIVTAEQHNPSLLNPDFLRIRGIVPDDWTVRETLTTPMLSLVRYDNGFAVLVKPERLQFSWRVEHFEEVAKVCASYIKTLPHVRYRSVNFEWRFFFLHDEPCKFIVERFMKKGIVGDPNGAGVTLSYEGRRAPMNLRFETARDNEGREGLGVTVLVTMQVSTYPADKEVAKLATRVSRFYRDVRERLNRLAQMEVEV